MDQLFEVQPMHFLPAPVSKADATLPILQKTIKSCTQFTAEFGNQGSTGFA
jgi:hypothetical protein